MAKTYIKPEKSTYHIEVSEPLVPVEPDPAAGTTVSRFTSFRCWSGGWERLSAREADEMTHFQVAQKLLEASSPDWDVHRMPDDSKVRLIQSRIYLLRKHGKEHPEFPAVFETSLGLLRQAKNEDRLM